ncbi:hypothetical protein Tco_1387808, partial [Tanacetum coccineum]
MEASLSLQEKVEQ